MRTIAHLSDLHFGRLDEATLPALRRAIEAEQPDVIVVSGDLTQRARDTEFAEAKAFLDTLPHSKVVVPGNHDVPLYNVLARWLSPLAAFRRHFGNDVEPSFADEEIAIVGLNTSRALTIQGGRLNEDQISRACTHFTNAPAAATRIVVTHHPFDGRNHKIVGGAENSIKAFADCGVDFILSGHGHVAGYGESVARYKAHGRSMLLVQAGTATSVRHRGEANSYNILRIDRDTVSIDRLSWNEPTKSFARSHTDRFTRAASGWARAV